MSATISLSSLNKTDTAYLDQLEVMFHDYYKSMEDKGLALKILDDGGKRWRKSIENGLGKVHNVICALSGDKVVGFIWGYIRLSPIYTGSTTIGVWNGLYIAPEYRRLGLSKRMYLELEKWFIVKKVCSIEGQVLVGHAYSKMGIQKMGFQDELLQLRKAIAIDPVSIE